MKKSLSLFYIILMLVTIFSCYGDKGKSDRQVIIITIDGLRADTIKEAYTPGLYSLLQASSYSLNANTVSPPITLPAHLSLISGLTPSNHTVTTNKWEEEIKKFNSKTIFSIASSNGLSSGIIVGKDKLKPLKNGTHNTFFQSVQNNTENVESIKNTALKYINNTKPNLVLIHFPEPDITGHNHNWLSKKYFDQVKEVDKFVYSLVKEIIENNRFNNYLIIITSDHGGIDNNHITDNEKNRKIPLIILGSGVKGNNKLDNEINIYDISPTVHDFLGFNTPSNLDGKIIDNIYID